MVPPVGFSPLPSRGGKQRNDDYLVDPDQTELGLKRRGQKLGVEVKGLVVKEWASLNVRPFSGIIELWTKWTTRSWTQVDDNHS